MLANKKSNQKKRERKNGFLIYDLKNTKDVLELKNIPDCAKQFIGGLANKVAVDAAMLLEIKIETKQHPEIRWCEEDGAAYLLMRHLLSKAFVKQDDEKKTTNKVFLKIQERKIESLIPSSDILGTAISVKTTKTQENFFVFDEKTQKYHVDFLKDSDFFKMIELYNNQNPNNKIKISIQEKVATATSNYNQWQLFTSEFGKENFRTIIRAKNVERKTKELIDLISIEKIEPTKNAEESETFLQSLDKVLAILDSSDFTSFVRENDKDIKTENYIADLTVDILAAKKLIKQDYSFFYLKHSEWFCNLKDKINDILILSDIKTIEKTEPVAFNIKISQEDICVIAKHLSTIDDNENATSVINHLNKLYEFDQLGVIIKITDSNEEQIKNLIQLAKIEKLNKFNAAFISIIQNNHISGRIGRNLANVKIEKSITRKILTPVHRFLIKIPLIRTIACPILSHILRKTKIQYVCRYGVLSTKDSDGIRKSLCIEKKQCIYETTKKSEDIALRFRIKRNLTSKIKKFIYDSKIALSHTIIKFSLCAFLLVSTIAFRLSKNSLIHPFVMIPSAIVDLLFTMCILDVIIDSLVFDLLQKISPIIKFIDTLFFRNAFSIVLKIASKTINGVIHSATFIKNATLNFIEYGVISQIKIGLTKIQQHFSSLIKSERQIINADNWRTVPSDIYDSLLNQEYHYGEDRAIEQIHSELFGNAINHNEIEQMLKRTEVTENCSQENLIRIVQLIGLRLKDVQFVTKLTHANIEDLHEITACQKLYESIKGLGTITTLDKKYQGKTLQEVCFLKNSLELLDFTLASTYNHSESVIYDKSSVFNIIATRSAIRLGISCLTKLIEEKSTNIAVESLLIEQFISESIKTSILLSQVQAQSRFAATISGGLAQCINSISRRTHHAEVSDEIQEIVYSTKQAKQIIPIHEQFMHFLKVFFGANMSFSFAAVAIIICNILKFNNVTIIVNGINAITDLPMNKFTEITKYLLGIDLSQMLSNSIASTILIENIYYDGCMLRDIIIDINNLADSVENRIKAQKIYRKLLSMILEEEEEEEAEEEAPIEKNPTVNIKTKVLDTVDELNNLPSLLSSTTSFVLLNKVTHSTSVHREIPSNFLNGIRVNFLSNQPTQICAF